ncbi:hypothetical protein [Methylocaldum szegediense]|nr:hypothetical protein [Methylocaldum szegediense]
MNVTQVKSFLILTVLAIIGFGPLSLTCLIGLYIVLRRPDWFYRVVKNLYRGTACGSEHCPEQDEKRRSATRMARIKTFLSLLVLLVLDIAPIPVAGSIGLYVVVARPCWFRRLVEKIYGDMDTQSDI